jgi:hypothetical protein
MHYTTYFCPRIIITPTPPRERERKPWNAKKFVWIGTRNVKAKSMSAGIRNAKALPERATSSAGYHINSVKLEKSCGAAPFW